ncbi:MAG: Hsp70 family protein [bacterium]
MKSAGVYLGIDLGTTNSSIAYVIADPRHAQSAKIEVRTVRVPLDEDGSATTDRIPSVVSQISTGRSRSKFLIAWEFFAAFKKRRKNAKLLRHARDFFRSVKSDLGSFRVYSRACSPELDTPQKVAAVILRRLIEQARAQLPGVDLRSVHVTVSVPASLSGVARDHTREAALVAGVDPSRLDLIDEPCAALLDFLNDGRAAGLLDDNSPRNLMVFDYGGGTLDLSLVRARFDKTSKTGLLVENLAISKYKRLGGDEVDRAIMRDVLWPQCETALRCSRESLKAHVRRGVEDSLTSTVARRLKERLCQRLRTGKGSPASNAEGVVIDEPLLWSFDVPDTEGKLPLRFRLTESQFRIIMKPFVCLPHDESEWKGDAFVQSLLIPVLEVLHKGRVDPLNLAAVVLHGGSCRNPLVREMLTEALTSELTLFGSVVIIETPELDSSVARGAALAGYWKHGRGVDIIPPIMAEEIGIMTLGDHPVRLLDSGQTLPFPDEHGIHEVPFDSAPLYVPADRLGQMLVPVYAGSEHRLVASVGVDLPETARRADPVRVKLQVDRDKTLRWWFAIKDGEFLPGETIHDPWCAAMPSAAERSLLEFRREGYVQHQASKGRKSIKLDTEMTLLYRAGMLDEAEVALRDYADDCGMDGWSSNLLAFICAQTGREEEALRLLKAAAAAEPTSALLQGNLGCRLLEANDLDAAEAALRQALSNDPDLVYVYRALGDCKRKRGREQEAQHEFAEGIRRAERHVQGETRSARQWAELSNLYSRAGKYEAAREAWQRWSQLEARANLNGDPNTRIAGPDSGFLRHDDLEVSDS